MNSLISSIDNLLKTVIEVGTLSLSDSFDFLRSTAYLHLLSASIPCKLLVDVTGAVPRWRLAQ